MMNDREEFTKKDIGFIVMWTLIIGEILFILSYIAYKLMQNGTIFPTLR